MNNLIDEAQNEINEDLLELLGEMGEPEADLDDDDINEVKEEQPYGYQNEIGKFALMFNEAFDLDEVERRCCYLHFCAHR